MLSVLCHSKAQRFFCNVCLQLVYDDDGEYCHLSHLISVKIIGTIKAVQHNFCRLLCKHCLLKYILPLKLCCTVFIVPIILMIMHNRMAHIKIIGSRLCSCTCPIVRCLSFQNFTVCFCFP
jgi:uncharacterized membrane protein YwaF